MAETHAQSVRKTRRGWRGIERGGEGQRRSERRYKRESVQNRGHLKGGRGQVSGREREGEEESGGETFRDRGCC